VGKLDSGVPYMVMEFLEGRDLSQLLGEQRRLPIDQAVGYIIQASEAIAEAHQNGIVHRDLKPANLFVTKALDGAPLVKVLDFGISKASSLLGAASPQITTTSAIIGSPKYMSPEQMQDSRAVDGRADIWALGVTIYELLSATPPFHAGALAELCAEILTAPPRPLRAVRPDVPPPLEAIVLRCLRKDPAERFATVRELAGALASLSPQPLSGLPSHRLPAPFSSNQTLVADETAAGILTANPVTRSLNTTPPAAASRRMVWPLAGLGTVLLITMLVLAFWPRPVAVSIDGSRAAATASGGVAGASGPPSAALPSSAPPATVSPAPVVVPSASASASAAAPPFATAANNAEATPPRPVGRPAAAPGPATRPRSNVESPAATKTSNPLDLEFK
jgi:eukaryotic-like serine/threonine-protein kinase